MGHYDRAEPGALQDALAQTAFALMAILTEVAALHDLSLTQLRLLGILRDHEPTIADLAAHTGLERSTVSGLVDRAVQRGLVVKTADPHDRRSVRVHLTGQARALAPELTAAISARLEPHLSRLTPADRVRLSALLTKAFTG